MASTIKSPFFQLFAQLGISNTLVSGSLEHRIAQQLTVGTAAGQVDIPYSTSFTVTNGAPLVIDLASATDPLGAAIVFAHWNFLLIENKSTATQTITITGSPTGGTFTLTYSGQTTTAIAYNATAATVAAALAALSTVGTDNVAVTGSAGGPWTAVFVLALGSTVLTASGGGLTGGTSPGVTIAALDTTMTWGGGTAPIFAADDKLIRAYGGSAYAFSPIGEVVNPSTAHNLKIVVAAGANIPGKLTIWGRST